MNEHDDNLDYYLQRALDCKLEDIHANPVFRAGLAWSRYCNEKAARELGISLATYLYREVLLENAQAELDSVLNPSDGSDEVENCVGTT